MNSMEGVAHPRHARKLGRITHAEALERLHATDDLQHMRARRSETTFKHRSRRVLWDRERAIRVAGWRELFGAETLATARKGRASGRRAQRRRSFSSRAEVFFTIFLRRFSVTYASLWKCKFSCSSNFSVSATTLSGYTTTMRRRRGFTPRTRAHSHAAPRTHTLSLSLTRRWRCGYSRARCP